jgi:hypothetical protein
MTKQVNIYRNAGVWAYALWIDGEFDHSDTLEAAREAEAYAKAATQFPGADVRRVADTNE